ncbi:MAG: oligosaccharide flippase family protein [Burkholderiales bacterium]|jgi:O-antigen/teichoic acid export membrane protein
MTDSARLAGAAAWNVGGKLFQFAVALVAVAVIARWVGPHAYGVFALSWIAVGLFEIVVSAAPSDGLVQRGTLRPGHGDATFRATLAIALAACLGLWAAADVLGALLGGGDELASILPARSLTLPLAAIACVPTALMMRAGRFRELAGAGAASGLVSAAVGIAGAIGGLGIWSLVAMELARQATNTALVLRAARWRPGFGACRAEAAELLGFNLRTVAAWGIGYVDGQLPRLLIGHLLGPQALGYYALAHRLYDQASAALMVPAYQAVMAGIARAQADPATVARLLRSATRAAGLVACPLFLGLAAVAPLLVPAFFGAQWVEAVPVVQVLMLLGVRASTSMVQMAVVRGMGRSDLHLAMSAAGLAMTVVLCALAAPFGLLGIAAAMVVRAWATWPIYARFVGALTGLGWRAQAACASGPFLAGLAMAAGTAAAVTAMQAAAVPPLEALAAAVACGAVLYVAALGVFARDAVAFGLAALRSVVRRDRAALARLLGGS